MAEPPDLQDLAKRYLDLWQDQLRAMAADPDTMASLGRMMAAAGKGDPAGGTAAPPNPFAWWPAAAALAPLSPFGGAATLDSVFPAGGAGAEARPPASAAPPDGIGDELRKLERRLAALEKRLDAMESGPGAGRRGGTGKARKRKS